MLNINFSANQYKYVIFISGAVLIGIFFLVWLNQGSKLEESMAEQRIRLLLARTVTNSYSQLFNENNTLDMETGLKLQQQLKEVNSLEMTGIVIKKLAPDYILRPHRPTYIVKAEVGNNGNYQTRYFWLSFSRVDRETSETSWLFAF